MDWKAYSLIPIDIMWEFLPTLEEVAGKIGAMDAFYAQQVAAAGEVDLTTFLASFESAKQAARDVGWEGDFRGSPRVLWLPMAEFSFTWGFVWKQDNNGETFVVSPYPLPWLEP
ncbi:MAG: hypothetical protein MO847_06375 [Candidatus Protistobacter heckmanni]|nr:hypothetical protein [Candidatus Protistobacter heckmanni]